MQNNRTVRVWLLLMALAAALPMGLPGQSFRQTQADDYTRYELLAPTTQSFRITYDVTATTAGAEYFYNASRVGSEPIVHAVYDVRTGGKLEWKLVDGTAAQEQGLARANPQGQYIQIKLARPVPQGGESRIRIDKTYKDPKSYYLEDGKLIFSRTLGIKRNAVVLPQGYELIGCNYPSQVMRTEDGRIKASYLNPGPAGVPYRIEARPLPEKSERSDDAKTQTGQEAPGTTSPSRPSPAPRSRARVNYRFSERAFQDREIVYFLQPPETHSFRLYHDYTESRVGMDRYLNVVRAGSRASNPSAKILDTGKDLKVETLKGEAIRERGIEIGQAITSETEVVVIWFDPVKEGHSARLRIEETYTDPNRYLLHGDDLIWDRSFGRPRNTVILPEGWHVTENSIPAVVSVTGDGQIQFQYVNDRQGNIDVFIRAKRR